MPLPSSPKHGQKQGRNAGLSAEGLGLHLLLQGGLGRAVLVLIQHCPKAEDADLTSYRDLADCRLKITMLYT